MLAFRSLLVFAFSIFLLDVAFAGFLPKTFEAEFTQLKKSTFKNKIVKTQMTLKYKFPTNINFWSVDKDKENLYICNGQEFWHYSPPFMEGEKGTLTTGKNSKHCYAKIFDTLSNGLKDNKLYIVAKKSESKYLLTFSAKASKQIGLKKLILLFEKDKKPEIINISKMFLHLNGNKKPLEWIKKSMKAGVAFKSSVFNFIVPENTEIIKSK